MLASITPLGQRGRRTSYSLTAAGLVLGGALGGAAAGALAGALGALAGLRGASAGPVLLAAALAAGLALDAAGRLPTVHRQVNEDWLGAYRGWVCGLGFEVQLGAGPATIVTSA